MVLKSLLLLGPPLTGKTTHLVERYRALVQQGLSVEQILCLSFYSANAQAIQQALRTERNEFFPGVTTLQRFQTLLLRDYANLPGRAREVSPATRALVIAQAWQDVGGPLWHEYGRRPGAIRELTRVIDWITQDRTRFVVAESELSNDELAQVYARYIALCRRHRLLTFQEASLRCLELLADAAVAAPLAERYPAVLVDDLHLARPDQLALVGKLREKAATFAATAWLEPKAQAPELKLIEKTIQAWGAREELTVPAPGVNPAVTMIAQRVVGEPAQPLPAGTEPVNLSTAFTVEDELHAVAQAIARALIADGTLLPDEIVVATASPSLLPFAQRILADYGLPVPPLVPLTRHTPLIQGGLLALRWVKEPESRLAVERDLLALPYLCVHPLDRTMLYRAAQKLEKTIVALDPADWPDFVEPGSTRATLRRARQTLEALDPSLPASQIVQTAVRELKGIDWAWREGPGEFSQSQRDVWTAAFSAWLSRLAELEATIGKLGAAPDDFLDLAAGLADTVGPSSPPGAIQLIDPAHTNGVHARLAFVVGLSENATPLLPSQMQLAAEEQLPRLFADGRDVVLPLARERNAWIEREGRQLAALLTRGREQLRVSVSHYTAGGDAQLPSPFFERLLGDEGEIDRDGNLKLTKPGLWISESPVPERQRPTDQGEPAGADETVAPETETRKVLADHTFSASQLRMYLTCPLQFFYGKVLNIEAEDEPAVFLRGSLMHEVLCATVGDGTLQAVDLSTRKRPRWLNDQTRLNARAQASLAAAWTGEPADLPEGGRYSPSRPWGAEFGPDLQRQAVRRWAGSILEKWADYEINGLADLEARRPVLLEATFTMTLGGYQLTGRIDRVDEVTSGSRVAYEVLDYKTGSGGADSLNKQIQKFLPGPDAAATDYQLPLYALALGQGIGEVQALPRAVSYFNLESLEKGKRGNFSTTAFRTIAFGGKAVDAKAGTVPVDALTGEITGGILQTLGQMSQSPYPARPDYHRCEYCAFRAACDRGRAEARGGGA